MQWSAEANAGFTSGTPWIKLNDDYDEWNVETQLASENTSVLGFWKRLLRLRKQHKTLVYGTFQIIDFDNESVYAYTRVDKIGQYLTICSFSEDEVVWECPVEKGLLLLGNYSSQESDLGSHLKLKPFEARLYYLERGSHAC